MKRVYLVVLRLFSAMLIFSMTGCSRNITQETPTSPQITPEIQASIQLPTAVLTDIPTSKTLLAQTLWELNNAPLNCTVPCFLGIKPSKSSMDQVKAIFAQLGFTPFVGKDSAWDFYTIIYNEDNNATVTFFSYNNVVDWIRVDTTVNQLVEQGAEQSVFSQARIIKKFGLPSKVDFFWGDGINTSLIMQLYFDDVGLTAQYYGTNIVSLNNGSTQLCPFTAPFESVRLWIGKDSRGLPSPGVPLEKATSLTMEQFIELMQGEPKTACFDLDKAAFSTQ